jgi:hypothetical protein
MVRTPEHEQGRPIFPGRTATRRRAAELQSSGPFKQYVEQFEGSEGKNNHPSIAPDTPEFSQADPEGAYKVGSKEIKGYQFPEGALPANATPVGKLGFFSRLFLKLGLIHQQK